MMYVPSEVMNVCIQSGPKIHWTRQNPMQHGYTKLRSLSALYIMLSAQLYHVDSSLYCTSLSYSPTYDERVQMLHVLIRDRI
jgi:hypothetical protein